MLTVAVPAPGTEAEHVAHRLFSRWDSGVRVLGGVAAFRPYDDPTSGRRQSDVVLLVPDGVIVVRLVGSQRQGGPIVTHPTGAWSIGGEVMRIVGGGSNPLPALRAAQAAVASTLRASGLEPGQVAMLVAVGSGEPVEPNDGRLTDGIIVCPMSEEGLAVGVRRAAALTAAADVRQWTTADVKAALSSIGAMGRVPAVEELNAEGFMYSPYVLRRPDLVAAASAVAASAAAAAAEAASPAEAAQAPAPPVHGGPPTQAVAADQPAAEGIPGLSGADADAVMAAHPPMPAASIEPHRYEYADPTGYDEPYADQSYADQSYANQSYAEQAHADNGGGGRRTVLRVVAVVATLLLVGAAAFLGYSLLGPDGGGGETGGGETGGGEPQASSEPAGPTSDSAAQQIGANSYVPVLSRDGETCDGNANGEVAEYFASTDCAALVREMYTTEVGGVAALVSIARVTMPDTSSADEFKTLVDSDGTGNLDDLLEAGDRFDNGPVALDPKAYASEIDGMQITIVVVGWLDPAATGDEQSLEQVALEALGLEPGA